jgi:hypothetical protein
MRLLIGCCISASLGLLSCSLAAYSQETGTASPAAAADQAAAQSTPATAAPAAPVAGQPTTGSNTVVDGPLKEQRQALLEKIEASQRLGFGIGPYRTAFNQVEEMTKSGASQDAIQKRLDSIKGSLVEQVSRLKDIKQRPSPPPGTVSSNAQAAAGRPAGNRQQMLEQMKDKYGDQIRGALSNPEIRAKLQDPAERQRILDSPLGQKLMEKFGGGGQ